MPLDPPCEPLTGDSHAHLLAPLQAFTESLGFTVSCESIPGATGGWCDQKARRILVDAAQPANSYGGSFVKGGAPDARGWAGIVVG
jgi:hypothetical protein